MRDRQRAWCPRCQGALLAPSAPPVAPAAAEPAEPGRLPAGFRWIAVRPGPPPPPRRPRRPLGPTPRYRTIPRWGLIDRPAPTPPVAALQRSNASESTVRITVVVAAAVFGLAALAHIARYVLLLINRSVLLPPLVAIASLLMGILVSLAAIVAVIATGVVMTAWLIGRRAEAFAVQGMDDPRPEWALWAGCMIPVVNLFWAPVFVIELAQAENARARLRTPITLWWLGWVFSTLVSAWAIWTSSATEPQGVADNTVTVIVAYLAGLAVLVLLWRIFDGFVRRPVQLPVHRWVIVAQAPEPDDAVDADPQPSASETRDREPAA